MRAFLTRDQQKELIKYFFIKFFAKTGGLEFGKNFVFCGINKEWPDTLARGIAEYAAHIINNRRNERGGKFAAALNSINHCLRFGEKTGALPEGRKSHQPLSKNLSAVIGMDREGVTALINSVTKIDFIQFPNGSVLDIMLHPTAVQGEEGLAVMVNA